MLARRLLAAIALSVLMLGTTGCGLLDGADDELPKGFVSVSISRPAALLPSAVSDAGGSQVLAALFTPLVRYDSAREPVQAAARSITSSDQRVWTIALADGHTFHNGERVTAQSYLDAWNYASYGPNKQRNAYLFERIDGFVEWQATAAGVSGLAGLKLVDELTFTVTLSTPFVDFRAMLGHPAFSPLPKAAFASPGVLQPGFADAVIGQGPFRLAGGGTQGASIDVRRHDAAPVQALVAGVRFQVYPDRARAYADLVADELDVVTAIPDGLVAEATRELGDRLQTSPGSALTMLAFPSSDRALREPAVRRAISMAIDRDTLVGSLFAGAQLPARSFVPPLVAGYRAGACAAACTFDAAAAKAAYQQAGGPATLRISYNADGAHQQWVDATCAQLAAALAVTCTGSAEPTFEALLAKVRGGQPVGLFRSTWFMDYPAKQSYLEPLFGSDGSSNFQRYQSPDFDAALRGAATARSAAAAVAGYGRAEAILARDMPVIPLRYGLEVTGRSARVSGVTVDVFGRVDVTALRLR